jgi:hypothetical protein
VAGRHPDVNDGEVGLLGLNRANEGCGVADACDDIDAILG